MNQDAGRGGLLFVTVSLEDGRKLPFVVDTGCPITSIDQSLEPKLGQRVRTDTVWLFGVPSHANIYSAPKLYLGETLLNKTGPYIATFDYKAMSSLVGHPIMGIIGMDILENYCVQLDFSAGKIRFLDDQHTSHNGWGKSFPLLSVGDGCYSINENLVGVPRAGSLIDTGCNFDGWLVPDLYQHWTNQTGSLENGEARSPFGKLGGQTYSKLDLHGLNPVLYSGSDEHIQFNGLGLHFLSRHLVTFDFPDLTMYLKRVSADALSAPVNADLKAPVKFIKKLKVQGKLPGWSLYDDMGDNNHVSVDLSGLVNLDLEKKRDSSTYHYRVSQTPGGQWEIQKAWRTDAAGHTIQEYPIR